jgi:competence ComEA-like helix-hairpin-helix protein
MACHKHHDGCRKYTLLTIFFLTLISISLVHATCEGVDINSASLDELDQLSGIGPVKAQAIIDTRPFTKLDDLIDVYGIGPATLEKIKSQGLACVEGENLVSSEGQSHEEEEPTHELRSLEEIKNQQTGSSIVENPQNQESENIINLNQHEQQDTVDTVYKSRNELIREYSIYAFAVFLVFLMVIILIKR